MAAQKFEEGVKDAAAGGGAQLSGEEFEFAVLSDELVGERAGMRGKQKLFLEFEMVDQFHVKAFNGSGAPVSEIIRRRVLGETARGHDAKRQAVVMLLRKRDEGGVALQTLLLT